MKIKAIEETGGVRLFFRNENSTFECLLDRMDGTRFAELLQAAINGQLREFTFRTEDE